MLRFDRFLHPHLLLPPLLFLLSDGMKSLTWKAIWDQEFNLYASRVEVWNSPEALPPCADFDEPFIQWHAQCWLYKCLKVINKLRVQRRPAPVLQCQSVILCLKKWLQNWKERMWRTHFGQEVSYELFDWYNWLITEDKYESLNILRLIEQE